MEKEQLLSCANGSAKGEQDMGIHPLFSSQPIALAMAYVAMQQWRRLYDVELGFKRGTIFAELDLPFIGEEATQR